MIYLSGLNILDQAICTRLWDTDSQEEIDSWISRSPPAIQERIIAMQLLIMAAVIDEEELDLTLANQVIEMVK